MITIKDIAELAGVSPTTVSNVLHGRTQKVSLDTLNKVNGILEKSNYVSNMGARSLANYGSRIIGVIVTYDRNRDRSAIQDPFYSEIIGALEREIRENKYFMMLYTSESVNESVRMAASWNIEGLIVLGCPPADCAKYKEKTQVPLVFIDSYAKNPQYPYYNVGLNDFEGGYEMTSYLIRRGHQRIAFMADTQELIGVDRERFEGYQSALLENHLQFASCDYIPIHYNQSIRHTQFTEFAQDRMKEYSALFIASDYYASDAVNIFFSLGFHVPEDISVVGFDDNVFARQCRPGLTTMKQCVSDKASYAMQMLLKLLQNETVTDTNIHLPVKLVIRDSVKQIVK